MFTQDSVQDIQLLQCSKATTTTVQEGHGIAPEDTRHIILVLQTCRIQVMKTHNQISKGDGLGVRAIYSRVRVPTCISREICRISKARPGAEEMAQGFRVLVGGRGAGELTQWLKALVVKNLGSIPSTHVEAHHLLRYQVCMWCTNVHARETLNHIKE